MRRRNEVVTSKLLAALVLVAVVEAGSAWADETSTVSEVLVTASHFGQATDRSIADANVLRPEDAPAGSTLGELLATASDVEVQQPGGASGVASIFVRGAKPNFTLVMFEGVPLNDQTNSRGGSTDVSGFNTLNLDRVELVRGGLSSVYGSGAIEGAVNLIAPSGSAHPSIVGSVGGGTDRDVSAGVSGRGPLGAGAGGFISADRADSGDAVEQSSRVNTAVALKVAPLDDSDQYSFALRLSRSDTTAFPDDSGGPRLAVLRTLERTRADRALMGTHWRFQVKNALSLELNAAGTTSRFDDVTPGVAPGPAAPIGVPSGTSSDRYTFARAQAILRVTGGRFWRALLGGEVQEEDGREGSHLAISGRAFPSSYTLHRTTPAAFAEANIDQGPLLLDSSVRVDQPGNQGDHVTGRVGMTLRLLPSLVARASAGRGFKSPSFYALGNAFIGNPTLRPETADTAEGGITWTCACGMKLETNLFHIQYRQLVDFDAGPPPRLVNRTSALSKGVDATLSASLTGRGTLRLSATYVDTRDQTSGSRLLELPAWRVTSAIDWRFSRSVRARFDFRYVGDRLDTSVPTGYFVLPPYSAVNARLLFNIRAGTDVEAGIENALGRRYEDAIGFPAPRTFGRISVVHHF